MPEKIETIREYVRQHRKGEKLSPNQLKEIMLYYVANHNNLDSEVETVLDMIQVRLPEVWKWAQDEIGFLVSAQEAAVDMHTVLVFIQTTLSGDLINDDDKAIMLREVNQVLSKIVKRV